MPEEFKTEVKRYITKWRSTGRLRKAIQRLAINDYGPRIQEQIVAHGLPAQFLYVALQESDFDPRTVGPRTKHGIAKGMWQFMPQTAAQYGLQVGSLADRRDYDPNDERFNFNKSTTAAARYLSDIYNTQAQASGLLVLASYNWGHNRMRRILTKLPQNPRERNFWALLNSVKIPKETYDYVFMIFSAAVIGEDPALFGFQFESPIGSAGDEFAETRT